MQASCPCCLKCICACLPGLPCEYDELLCAAVGLSDNDMALSQQPDNAAAVVVYVPVPMTASGMWPCKAATYVHEQQWQWMCCMQQMVQQ
jgi:hypothetical protein